MLVFRGFVQPDRIKISQVVVLKVRRPKMEEEKEIHLGPTEI